MITQIYSMQTPEEALSCVEAGADHIGVNPTAKNSGMSKDEAMAKCKAIFDAVGDRAVKVALTIDDTPEEQIEIIEKTQKIIKEITGKAPVGFRTPSGDWAVETPYLLEERGFSYSSSMRGDDRPYHTVLDGRVTDFIEIPSKWELDDYVAQAYSIYPAEPAGLDRISCYRNVQDTYLREFRGYHRYGLCISFLMHPQISGAPGRNLILEEILKEVTSHPDVWIATGAEIADWWRATYPTDPQ